MANKVEVKELLNAGVHFGHLTRRWNPNMAPYIYMERNGIHIINLYKSAAKMQEAGDALSKIAASGRKILFVATKKQAKEIVAEQAEKANMPYITERWPGGMLTNFVTIRKAVKKMASIDRMKKDGTFNTLSKKERLQVDRLRAKLEKNLGSISEMSRLPGALFVVDITREHIAVKEAQKLNIPIFAMVDTNSNPRDVDYVIPSNDDASKSISKVVTYVSEAIVDGLAERKAGKESKKEETEEKPKAAKPKKEESENKEPSVEKETKPKKAAQAKKETSEEKEAKSTEGEKENSEGKDTKPEKASETKKVASEEKEAKSTEGKKETSAEEKETKPTQAKQETSSEEKETKSTETKKETSKKKTPKASKETVEAEVPSKDPEDKKAMKEAKEEVKLESKEDTLEKAEKKAEKKEAKEEKKTEEKKTEEKAK